MPTSDSAKEHMAPTVETVQESATELGYLHVEKHESTPTLSPSSVENTQEEETPEQDLDDSKPAAFVPNDDNRNETGMENILAGVSNRSIDQNLDATREEFSTKEFNDPIQGIADDKNIDHDAKEQRTEAPRQMIDQPAEFEGDETVMETCEPEVFNEATTPTSDLHGDDNNEGNFGFVDGSHIEETQIPLRPRVCDPEDNLRLQYNLKDPPASAPAELNDHSPWVTSTDFDGMEQSNEVTPPATGLQEEQEEEDSDADSFGPAAASQVEGNHIPVPPPICNPFDDLTPQYKLKDPPPTSALTELSDHSPGGTSTDFGGMELSNEVGTPRTGLQDEEDSDADSFGPAAASQIEGNHIPVPPPVWDPEDDVSPQYKLKDPPPSSAPTQLSDQSPGGTSAEFFEQGLFNEVKTPPTGLQEEENDLDSFGFVASSHVEGNQIPIPPTVCDLEEDVPPQYKLKDPPPTSAPTQLNDYSPAATATDFMDMGPNAMHAPTPTQEASAKTGGTDEAESNTRHAATEDVGVSQRNGGTTSGVPRKKREINPDFKDVQSTGKWGSISKLEIIVIGVVSLLILVGIIVALVLVLGGDEEMKVETVPPITSAPTTQATPMPAGERFSLLINQLESNNVTAPLVDLFPDNPDYYDPSYLEGLVNNDYCKSKAFDCAMSWILYEDAFPPESNDIVDRFGLAAFYYSLGGEGWKNNTNWLSPESYCEWHGIKCNRAQTDVEEIDLSDNDLNGEVPLELALVDSAAVVSLKKNAITGKLNGEIFASMENLFVLYLQENKLTGAIPDNLHYGGLAMLFIQENSFTGPLPNSYCLFPEPGNVFSKLGLDCKEKNPCPEGCCDAETCY